MGDKKVSMETDESRMRQFTKAVLNDLQALEKMLAGGQLEENVLRIGAEQEMFFVAKLDGRIHEKRRRGEGKRNARAARRHRRRQQRNSETARRNSKNRHETERLITENFD